MAGITSAIIGGIGVLGAVASGVSAVAGMFGGKESSPAPVVAEPPATDDAEAIAKAEIDAKRRAVARNESIFTASTGLTEEEKSDTTLKTLLGE